MKKDTRSVRPRAWDNPVCHKTIMRNEGEMSRQRGNLEGHTHFGKWMFTAFDSKAGGNHSFPQNMQQTLSFRQDVAV